MFFLCDLCDLCVRSNLVGPCGVMYYSMEGTPTPRLHDARRRNATGPPGAAGAPADAGAPGRGVPVVSRARAEDGAVAGLLRGDLPVRGVGAAALPVAHPVVLHGSVPGAPLLHRRVCGEMVRRRVPAVRA